MPDNRPDWAFALHGGAGAVAGRDYAETEKHLAELAAACKYKLERGGKALNIVEFAVAELESCGLYVAGRGSAVNSAGYVELDASIMDGATRAAGAVAALSGFQSPVGVARCIMEKTKHVMLTGTGAAVFARRQGFAEVTDPKSYYRLPIGVTRADAGGIAHGTVGAVALDRSGGLAAATSTGGTFGKLEGRVGDTPLIGPGTWADDNVAISCTGVGEHIIRSGGASSIAFRLRSGLSLHDAVMEMLDEVARLGGDGGVIAVTRDGEIAMPYNSQGMKRASATSTSKIAVQTFADQPEGGQ
jgi:isoaspartyl peptidase/L-asparaginase-like protein (Ntn-hydrolase superfamily)